MNTKLRTLVAGLGVAGLLAACGGGGGGSDTPGTPPPPPPPTIPPSTLVTQVPAPTYAANSYEKAVYDVVQGARSRCGFGLLAQDARLDLMAADHAHYSALNTYMGHQEDPSKPGYTGATVVDRANYRGYSYGVSEVGSGLYADNLSDYREYFRQSALELIATTYHGAILLGGWQHIGIGTAQGTSPEGWGTAMLYINPGDGPQGQDPAGDQVLIYPCDGEVLGFRNHSAETPSPLPGHVGQVGHPIFVQVRHDQALSDVVITLRDHTGKQYPMLYRTEANDPNRFIQPYLVVGLPDADLPLNTTFTAVITGKNKGVAFSKTVTYKTPVKDLMPF